MTNHADNCSSHSGRSDDLHPARNTHDLQVHAQRAQLTPENHPGDPSIPVYDFEALADGQRLVMIRLGSEFYMLRRTLGGKLLLNK